jgi:uncharacterized protein (TIGR04255 family)
VPSELTQPAPTRKNATRERTLPDFENPPAVETYLGVSFDPLKTWKIPHFGLFWSRIKDGYPKMEVHPPIALASPPRAAQAFEFGIGGPQAELKIPARCWFINQDDSRLIQVQDNLFIHNWRRPGGSGKPYSHYADLRPIFEEEWRRFANFLGEQGLGKVNASMCEVAYINHLDRGAGWQSFADLSSVSPCWSGVTSGPFLPPPQAAAIRSFYTMKEPEGQLEISLLPAVRQTDAKEIIQLTVTGRCKPASPDSEEILSALDAAHKWVVRGFTDFTSPQMHEIWGRII